MTKVILGVLLLAAINTSIFAEDIGFKNIFLGTNGMQACLKLKKIGEIHQGEYPYVEDLNSSSCTLKYTSEHLGIFYMYSEIFDLKYARITYDENKIVNSIYFNYSEFGIKDVDTEAAAEIFVNNIDWIDYLSAEYNNENKLYYEYTDIKRGIYIHIDGSAIYVEKINNKFSF